MASPPLSGNTPLQVAELYARLDLIDQAVSLFSRLAEQRADAGSFEEAIRIYKKVIQLDPTRLAVYETLADLYRRQGRTNHAREQYGALVEYYRRHRDLEKVAALRQRMAELD